MYIKLIVFAIISCLLCFVLRIDLSLMLTLTILIIQKLFFKYHKNVQKIKKCRGKRKSIFSAALDTLQCRSHFRKPEREGKKVI